jgi:hypothetical protein
MRAFTSINYIPFLSLSLSFCGYLSLRFAIHMTRLRLIIRYIVVDLKMETLILFMIHRATDEKVKVNYSSRYKDGNFVSDITHVDALHEMKFLHLRFCDG